MAKTITLRDANQGFSRYVRAVEAGEEFVITRNGAPVAKLVPVRAQRVLTPEQEAAWARAEAIMREGFDLGGERFDRDAAHDRDAEREAWRRNRDALRKE
jgi:prevent-host-death family protein